MTHEQHGDPRQRQARRFSLRDTLKPMLFSIVFIAAYFLSAGRLNLLLSWIYFALLLMNSILLTFLMDPELIKERAGVAEGSKRSDLPHALILGRIGPIVVTIVAGLDTRFGWTHLTMRIAAYLAFIVMVPGICLSDWAVITNRFFSGVVRIQKDRGHRVISDGPYRYIRHPGYLGSILYHLATPIILQSLWAIIPSLAVVAVIVVRTANEDRILHEELEGYAEYSTRVVSRLVPHVW